MEIKDQRKPICSFDSGSAASCKVVTVTKYNPGEKTESILIRRTAMTTILPEVVIGWVQSILNLEDFRLIELRRHGSHALKVTELKSISYEIDKKLSEYCLNNVTPKEELALFQERFHRPSSNSKKDSWVRYIQNCFFKNRLLGVLVPKDDVIWRALNITCVEDSDNGKAAQEEEQGKEDNDDNDDNSTNGTSVSTNMKRKMQVDRREMKKRNNAKLSIGETSEKAIFSSATTPDARSWNSGSPPASSDLHLYPSSGNTRTTSAHRINLDRHVCQDDAMRTIIHDRDTASTNALSSSYANSFNSLYANNRVGGPSYQIANPDVLLRHRFAASRPQDHLMPMNNLGGMMPPPAFLQNTPTYSSILSAHHPRMIYSDANIFPPLMESQYGANPSYLNQSLLSNNNLVPSLQRERRELHNLPPSVNPQSNINLPHNLREENDSTMALSLEPKAYPSKLAALAAHRVKIKKEKLENSQSSSSYSSSATTTIPLQFQKEPSSVPRSMLEQYVLNEITSMGFSNNAEVMIALRQVQQKGSSPNNHTRGLAGLVEETVVYILSQKNKRDKRKGDVTHNPGAQNNITAQEEKKNGCIIEKSLIETSSIEEIIGFEDDGNSGNSSIHFLSSFLLTSTDVKKIFRAMMLFDLSNSARDKVAHLLTLEKKALKWFGRKIPYAYFGIQLPEKMSKWSYKDIDHDRMEDLTKKLQSEIDLIEKGMYNLSEQVKGDLGLMLPKIFIEARKVAIEKGLLEDEESKSIIVVDDESDEVDLNGFGPGLA